MENKRYEMQDIDTISDEGSQIIKDTSQLAVENFKPLSDVIKLNDIFKCPQPDPKLVLELLCSRSRKQRCKIGEHFQKAYRQSLNDVISKHFKQKELRFISQMLNNDFDTAYSILLHEAITRQMGPIVSLMTRTRKDPESDPALARYRTYFKKSVSEDIEKHFSGDVKRLLVTYLQPTQKNKLRFRKTATNHLINIFSICELEYLKLLCSEFHELTDNPIIKVFSEKLKPATSEVIEVLEELSDGTVNPYTLMLKKYLSKEKDICHSLILLRSDEDLLDISRDYLTKYGVSLLSDCRNIYQDDQLFALEKILALVQ
ncbi:Annexin A3 [Thelohanellus kitauei]|uniref:Annexin A3 n=1 Tax=Thelohanellus kitauei TaxID=669202 RepID=A0A0C2JMD5_THEKT|nr:Annexin A3 [Thelohanellus kitauei]